MGGAQGQWPCCVYLFPPWRTGTGTLPCLHCGWPFLALPLRRFARAVRLGRDARQSRARATPSPHGAPLSRARSSHALPRPSARAGRILTGQAGARGRPRRKHSCKIISRTHKHLAPTQVTGKYQTNQQKVSVKWRICDERLMQCVAAARLHKIGPHSVTFDVLRPGMPAPSKMLC